MKIDLKYGKDEDPIHGCPFNVIGDCCCEDMEIALTWGHIISNGVDMDIPDHEDCERDKPIAGGLTIRHCPWCGEKIELINPWKPYWTAEKLDELCPEYCFWL
jgi:hypothetical protein